MFLSKKTYQRSESEANNLLAKCGISRAPVPVDEIAFKLGLNVVPYNLGDDISGVLIMKDDRGSIGINPKDHFYRQRFSIAHELGHFVLHRKPNGLFVDKDFLVKYRYANQNYTESEKKQEQEANAFAAALLMPIEFIRIEMQKEELTNCTETELISKLASKFKVSEVAMSYRFANLNSYH